MPPLEFVGDAGIGHLQSTALIDCTETFWRPGDYPKIEGYIFLLFLIDFTKIYPIQS